jgi:hypothetical protein
MFLGYTSCRSPILPGSREFVYPSLLKRPDLAHREIALDPVIQHDPVDRSRRLWPLEASQSASVLAADLDKSLNFSMAITLAGSEVI